MNPFTRLIRPAAQHSRAMADTKARAFIEKTLNVPLHKFGDYDSYLKAGSKRVWATFRSCHLVGSAVLGAEFKTTIRSADGTAVDVKNTGDMGKFLDTPNPFDSWEEMLYMWVFHMKLTGNAYWLKDEVNGRGQPLHLYPLLPQHMHPTPDAQKKISSYAYKINGRVLEYAPEEIIHFRRPHPSDLIFGLGDIEPAESLYNDYINRKTLEEKFIENGATPSGVMTREDDAADEMDQADWALLKNKWLEEYSGTRNAGKVMFLPGKWRYEKLGLTHLEMQSIEKEKLSVDQIFMNHGVPLSVAGVRESSNYATARIEELNFRKYEVVPLIRLLVGKLNAEKQFVQTFNPAWRLDFNLSGLVDVEQAWKDYGQLYSNGGMTPNEMRQQMGLDKMDDPLMDVIYMPQGRVPLDMVAQGGAPAEDPAAAGKTPDIDMLELLALRGAELEALPLEASWTRE